MKIDLTFRTLHLCVLQFPSSQGWYIPSVTQLNRITVIVRRSNQLEFANDKDFNYIKIFQFNSMQKSF
jgi:hypothetical protein